MSESKSRKLSRVVDDGASIIPFQRIPYDRGTIGHELSRTVWVDAEGDYNPATGTGTDDYLAFVQAFAALDGPGIVRIPRGQRCLILSTLVIPPGVTIQAESGRTFMGLDGFDAGAGDLYLGAGASLTLGNASALRRCVVFRQGIQFGITSAQVTTQFTGTAIILRDSTWDHLFDDVVIAGFLNGIVSATSSGSNQCNRTRFINRVMIDCMNGVRIYNAFDIPILDGIECWPLVTYNSAAEPNGAQIKRDGTAVWLHGVNDWSKIHVPFNYGWKIGFRITDAGSCTLVAAGSDYPYQSTPDGSVGFVLDGASWENRLLLPQAAQRDTAVYVTSTSALMAVHIYGLNAWECRLNGVAVAQGHVQVVGGSIRSSFAGAVGVQTGPSAGKVDVVDVDFRNVSTALSNDNSGVRLRHRGCRFTNVQGIAEDPYRPTIASAATITPNGEDMVFFLTGSAAIGTIENAPAYLGLGPVTFICVSNPSFLTGGNIALSSSFAPAAGTAVQLVSNGTGWSGLTEGGN